MRSVSLDAIANENNNLRPVVCANCANCAVSVGKPSQKNTRAIPAEAIIANDPCAVIRPNRVIDNDENNEIDMFMDADSDDELLLNATIKEELRMEYEQLYEDIDEQCLLNVTIQEENKLMYQSLWEDIDNEALINATIAGEKSFEYQSYFEPIDDEELIEACVIVEERN